MVQDPISFSSKKVLREWAENGEEDKARERLEMLRNAPSIVAATKAAVPAELAALGCDAATWTEMRDKTKAALLKSVQAGDEAAVRERLGRIRAAIERDASGEQTAGAAKKDASGVGRKGGRRKEAPKRRPEAPAEVPAQLVEWGCDAALWKAIHSKQSLLALVKQGNEEYARRRIERMRELVAAAAAEEASA